MGLWRSNESNDPTPHSKGTDTDVTGLACVRSCNFFPYEKTAHKISSWREGSCCEHSLSWMERYRGERGVSKRNFCSWHCPSSQEAREDERECFTGFLLVFFCFVAVVVFVFLLLSVGPPPHSILQPTLKVSLLS